MSYTGRVEVGGPAAVRELPALVLSKLAVGPMGNNAYLLRCRESGRQLLIDAADDPSALLGLIGAGGLETVVTTHRHRDHWQGLAAVLAATGARSIAHRDDAAGIPRVDAAVTDGEVLEVGAVRLQVLHVPGHTPGSIVLAYDDPEGHAHLFTGDTLFPGGVGATFGDAAAFRQLYDGVVARVFDRFGDETWVYPGHGADTTLGSQRPHLAEWAERGW